MVSVILGSSYHTDVISLILIRYLMLLKRGWDVMIDSCESLSLTSCGCAQLAIVSGGWPWYRGSTDRSLLVRLWLKITSKPQYGSSRIRDILASLLYSERKWRRVVHLYIQSMPQPKEVALLCFFVLFRLTTLTTCWDRNITFPFCLVLWDRAVNANLF